MIFMQQNFPPPSRISSPAVCCKNHGAAQRELCRIRPKPPWCLPWLWQQSWSLQTVSQGLFLIKVILDDKWLPESIHQHVCHTSYQLLSSCKNQHWQHNAPPLPCGKSPDILNNRGASTLPCFTAARVWPGTQCARLLSQNQDSVKTTLFCSFICVCALNMVFQTGLARMLAFQPNEMLCKAQFLWCFPLV